MICTAYVRVLGADVAGGAAEQLGHEAVVTAHAADGGRRLRWAACAGGGDRVVASHGSMDALQSQMDW